MSTKLISHEDNKAIFTVEVEYKEFNKEVQQSYLKNRKGFNIPGFRKGKAPKQIIELNYGKEVFWSDALDSIIPKEYLKAVTELEIEPIDQPSVDVEDIEEGKDIVLKFEVETKPEVELGDYSVIEVEKLSSDVSEDEIDAVVKEEQEKNKIIKPVEGRPVEDGDLVNIDFEGFKDGVAFEGGKGESYDLSIGSNTFIPGFEEQLIGKEVGEEVDVELSFPDDYHAEDLAGEEVVFQVKINGIKEEILPELDDDFAMDVSEFDTLEDYKDSIAEELEEQKEKNNEIILENAVVEKLVELSDVLAPNVMVEEQLNQDLSEYEHNLSHMGLTLETYMQYTGGSVEDLKEQMRDQAEMKVKADLVLEALANKEEIEATDEEYEEEINLVAEQYGQKDSEEFIKQIKATVSEDFVKNVVRKKKAVELLKENVKFVAAE